MEAMSQTLTVALKEINDEMLDIVEEEVFALHNGLIDAGQAVWDTGNFKNSFAPVQKITGTHWNIINDAEYSGILANGRMYVNGRWYGSEKWEHGIDPMIAKMNEEIKKRTDKVKR